MALWDEHLGIGVRREGSDDVVGEGDDPLDDHFSTVDGVSEGDDVAYGDRPPGANAEAVKDDDIVRRGRVWIECGLHASTPDSLYGVAVVGKGQAEGQPVQHAEGSGRDVHPNGSL